jgi:citrate lyase subunit beta-like protein
MPGDDWKKITKSITLGVDCICMDMEDGVAVNRKAEARIVIARAVRELDFGASERCIRINSIGSGCETEDLAAALEARPDTIVVPKVESPEHVVWASEQIETYELAHNLTLRGLRLLIGVETAMGILNLKEIAAADRRLDAIIFGGEDFAASIGATRTKDAVELLYARQVVVTACAAFNLQAIDIVTIDFKDLDIVRAEAEFGARLGYSGKQIIHPAQVEPVQTAFTPNDEAIANAKRIVELSEASQKAQERAESFGTCEGGGKTGHGSIIKTCRTGGQNETQQNLEDRRWHRHSVGGAVSIRDGGFHVRRVCSDDDVN